MLKVFGLHFDQAHLGDPFWTSRLQRQQLPRVSTAWSLALWLVDSRNFYEFYRPRMQLHRLAAR